MSNLRQNSSCAAPLPPGRASRQHLGAWCQRSSVSSAAPASSRRRCCGPPFAATTSSSPAVASRRNAQGYADRFGIEWAYDSYAELLADPDLDLVYNALPPSLHAQWSIAALEEGKHVLCEKPFTQNAAEAERVVTSAERSGRRAIEAFHFYHPLSAWVRNFLAVGGVGAVRRAEAIFTERCRSTGHRYGAILRRVTAEVDLVGYWLRQL